MIIAERTTGHKPAQEARLGAEKRRQVPKIPRGKRSSAPNDRICEKVVNTDFSDKRFGDWRAPVH